MDRRNSCSITRDELYNGSEDELRMVYRSVHDDGNVTKVDLIFPKKESMAAGRKENSYGSNRDEWSGLADFLGNMIAKYASEIDIDSMEVPEGMEPQCRGKGIHEAAGSTVAAKPQRVKQPKKGRKIRI